MVSLSFLQRSSPRFTTLLLLVSLGATGCEPADVPCGLLTVLEDSASPTTLLFDRCTGQFALDSSERDEAVLPAAPAGAPALAWAEDQLEVTMTQGRYVFEGGFGLWRGLGEGQLDANTWSYDDEVHPASAEWQLGEHGESVVMFRV